MYTKKEVAVQISKRRCNFGSYKGEVARSHPFFSVRKQYFFTSMSKLGYIATSCKNILLSNTLHVCFLCKIDNTIDRYIGVKNLDIVLASKDNTIAKHQIYLPRNSE